MKIKLLSGIAIVGLALVMAGCQKYPQVEVDAANAAVEAAKTAQANLYVASEFNALQDSLNTVLAAVEKEKSKLFKNYKDEVAKLTATTELAKTVAANAVAKKEQMKQECTATLAEITVLMDANKEMLAKAPKGKEGKAAMEAIQADLTSIETQVGEVNNKFASDDIINALNQAKALKDKATSINTELTDVMAKTKGKKK
jgi:tRNA U34 5-carboxymethylaminomethyl modifying GTPase MnmE/TrmE